MTSFTKAFIILSLILPSLSESLFGQKRVNAPTLELLYQENLTDFTYWSFNNSMGEWKGSEGRVSDIHDTKGGITLSKWKYGSDLIFSITYESDTHIDGYLINDYHLVDLYESKKLSLICSSSQIERGLKLGLKEDIEVLSEIVKMSIRKYKDTFFCEKYLPVFRSNEGPIRIRLFGLAKIDNDTLYEQVFTEGPYIEIPESIFRDVILSENLNPLIIERIKGKKPNVMDNTRSGERTSKGETETKPSNTITLTGSNIMNTRTFTVKSPWRISWSNDGSFMSGYLMKSEDDLVDVIINSTSTSGSNTLYHSGTFYIKMNSIGNWRVTITQ